MKEILTEIQSGKFTKEWMKSAKTDKKTSLQQELN